MRVDMLIGGQFVAGEGAAPPVLDPATGEIENHTAMIRRDPVAHG